MLLMARWAGTMHMTQTLGIIFLKKISVCATLSLMLGITPKALDG